MERPALSTAGAVCEGLLSLPNDLIVRDILSRLGPADLASAACASRRLSTLAGEDTLWEAQLCTRLPRLVRLLDSAPAPWWAGATWRQRTISLVQGATFQAQVYNREPENEAEDFLLSAYDATCWLAPTSAAALLREPGSSGDGGSSTGSDDPTRAHASAHSSGGAAGEALGSGGDSGGGACSGSAASKEQHRSGSGSGGQQLVFARYLPMGNMRAVQEEDVSPVRLRVPPQGSSPFGVYGGSSGISSSAGLTVGEEVEVQWKGRRSHPFGWWFGTVQSVRGDRVALLFRQYPRTSVWHRVRAPIKPGREAVVNGDCTFGYVGGLRRLTAGEREEWRRHGAPHPPAPAQLRALAEEEAEEEWEEEEDEDAELAGEVEDEEEVLMLAAAGGGAGEPAILGAPAAAGAVQPAGAAAPAAAGLAGPPGQPIAVQLGQAAAAAGAAHVGAPVELAAVAEGLAPLHAYCSPPGQAQL